MSTTDPRKPRVPELLRVFGRIANSTFGGGGATVAALQRELVTRLGWLEDAQFALCYALSRVTPGTNLLAFCTASGWLLRRWRGAIAVVLVASIPSCALVWAVTAGFDSTARFPAVQVAIGGAMAASIGILLASFWLLVRPYLTRESWPRSCAIVTGSILLSLFANMSPVAVLAVAVIAGFFWQERPPRE